jgi:dihydrofolate reductase
MNNLEITIEMACSINGLIAAEDGNEDFLLHRNYEIMLEFLKEYDVLIWGRVTFENVISWGENYLDDLKDTNVIILSKNSIKEVDLPNIHYCNSLEAVLELCKDKGYKKLFISGGATTNNLFMEHKLVDKIILNYNPYILNKGIPLFKGPYFENKLELEKVVEEKEGIIQIHYRVCK